MATIDPITGLPSSNVQTVYAGDKLINQSFQTPSVVTPASSSVSTNANFSQIATPTTPLPSFTPPTVAPDTSKVAGIVAGTNENLVQQQQAEIANSQEQQMYDAINQKIKENLGLSGTAGIDERKAIDQAALMQAEDVTGKKATVKSLLAQIDANKVKAALGGEGTKFGGMTLGQYNSDIESKNLMLGAQLLVAQGQYDSAKEAVTDAITMKYAPEEARNNALLKYAEINKDALGKKADQIKELATARIKDAEKRQTEEKDVAKLIIDASPVAPADVLNKAKAIQAKGGSATDVALALGQYGGDYYKTALLKQQIETEKAQRANINSQIRERDNKVSTTTVVTGKDGVIATLPKAAQDRYYKMQGDFDQATKTYRGAIDAAGSVKALSKDASPQDQTAIIFQYMKTLDPNSTVREGEFALVAATAGLGDRAVNALKRLDNGQRLNDTQIKDIVGATDKLANNAKANLQATSKEYDRRAIIQGLPKGLFLDTSTQEITNPNDTPEAQAIKAKLEAANPALKKQPFEGTSIIKNINGTAIDFSLPTTKK